jgi:ribonuclease/clavin/mitogillin
VSDLLSLFPSVQIHKNNPSLKGEHKTWLNIHDGQVFKVEGATLTAVHCPGHTTDHMAFVLEEEDAMFTGDNVLGHGTAVFEDLATYLSSLELMGAKFNGRAYPGHGDVIENGKAKIKEYIAHRKQREGQVLDVLGQAKEEEGKMSSMEIVKVIYADYPENLHRPAEMGVVQVLRKLVKDGRVQEVSGRWKVAGNANL